MPGFSPIGARPISSLNNAVSAVVAYSLSGAASSFVITGNAGTFTYTPVGGVVNYTLSGAASSFVITGNPATFTFSGSSVQAGKRRKRILLDYHGKIHEFDTREGADEFIASVSQKDIANIETKAKRVVKALQKTGNEFKEVPFVSISLISGDAQLSEKIELRNLAQQRFFKSLVERRIDADRIENMKREALAIARQVDEMEESAIAAIMMLID